MKVGIHEPRDDPLPRAIQFGLPDVSGADADDPAPVDCHIPFSNLTAEDIDDLPRFQDEIRRDFSPCGTDPLSQDLNLSPHLQRHLSPPS
jgi:hypothetical protein